MLRTLQLLLFGLLFLGKSSAICMDPEGRTWICTPPFASFAGDTHDQDCECPCEGDDCEEREAGSDYLLGNSLRIPDRASDGSAEPEGSSKFSPLTGLFDSTPVRTIGGPNCRRAELDSASPSVQMHERLVGVVMRL